tara:strand:+ start:697 stop:1650 length:954 start_codon:yes stop_codon:yes gene_type:complete
VLKKAIDRSAMTSELKQSLNEQPTVLAADRVGIQGDPMIQPLPEYNRGDKDSIIDGHNGGQIVMTSDRPGEKGSGYGNETGAATIDIVTGRASRDVKVGVIQKKSLRFENLSIDPNLAADASRIYISQKTDVDENFALAKGTVGNSKAKAAIMLKSDAIRIVAREGIKLITKTDALNSAGAPIRSVPSIDILAGNIDETREPAVKGKTLRVGLETVMKRIDELNSVLDKFMQYQVEFNTAIQSHDHPDFFAMFLNGLNGGKCPLSPELLVAGIKASAGHQISKHDGAMNKMKLAASNKNISKVFGAMEASSTRVNIN